MWKTFVLTPILTDVIGNPHPLRFYRVKYP
jgi:hypothetical protein